MALRVYDMQAGIAGQLPQGPEVIRRVVEVLGAAREGGFPVFFSRHVSLPKELMGASQLRQQMAWQRVDRPEDVRSPFPPNASHSQIVAELEPLPSGAVSDEDRHERLLGNLPRHGDARPGRVSFAIVGIVTEVGIEPIVHHGTDLGYVPVVVTDACGAGDEEGTRHSVEVLKHAGDALFTDAATICARLRRPRGVEFTTSRLGSRPGWIKPQSSQQKRSRARRHEGVRKGARPRLPENRISEPILRLLGPV